MPWDGPAMPSRRAVPSQPDTGKMRLPCRKPAPFPDAGNAPCSTPPEAVLKRVHPGEVHHAQVAVLSAPIDERKPRSTIRCSHRVRPMDHHKHTFRRCQQEQKQPKSNAPEVRCRKIGMIHGRSEEHTSELQSPCN